MKTIIKNNFFNVFKIGLVSLVLSVGSSSITHCKPVQPPKELTIQIPVNIKKQRILASIADVESSGGKNTNHSTLPQKSIHRGEKAFGKYALTPLLIRETVQLSPDLSKAHPKLLSLMGDKVHEYMKKNPGLEDIIASKHYDRLAQHFGETPEKISMAWLGGISGTWKMIKSSKPLKQHWHVKKFLAAYDKRKKATNNTKINNFN